MKVHTTHVPSEVKIMAVIALVTLPAAAFAIRTLKDLIDLTITYLGYVIPFIISLSMVVFIWGIYKYFFKVDTNKEEAGQLVLWGVVGLFVMISFWGLVNILVQTFNLDTHVPGIPMIRVQGGGSYNGTNSNTNGSYNGTNSTTYGNGNFDTEGGQGGQQINNGGGNVDTEGSPSSFNTSTGPSTTPVDSTSGQFEAGGGGFGGGGAGSSF